MTFPTPRRNHPCTPHIPHSLTSHPIPHSPNPKPKPTPNLPRIKPSHSVPPSQLPLTLPQQPTPPHTHIYNKDLYYISTHRPPQPFITTRKSHLIITAERSQSECMFVRCTHRVKNDYISPPSCRLGQGRARAEDGRVDSATWVQRGSVMVCAMLHVLFV